MDKIEGVFKVWDNGVVTPFDPDRYDLVEYHESIRQKTGAKYGVFIRTLFQGIACDYPKNSVPIPDMSGLVYATDKWKKWVVLNADGTTRGIIEVPRISEKSRPELGDLGNPKYFKGMAPHIMYGEGGDGDREDCRFFFDMHTCKLLSVDLVGKHW